MKDVLVTCPPMLGQIDRFMDVAAQQGLRLHAAQPTQTLSEDELKQQLPNMMAGLSATIRRPVLCLKQRKPGD